MHGIMVPNLDKKDSSPEGRCPTSRIPFQSPHLSPLRSGIFPSRNIDLHCHPYPGLYQKTRHMPRPTNPWTNTNTCSHDHSCWHFFGCSLTYSEVIEDIWLFPSKSSQVGHLSWRRPLRWNWWNRCLLWMPNLQQRSCCWQSGC